MEYVSIKNVLNFYSNVDVEKLKKIIKNEIANNKSNSNTSSLIEFPEFISNNKDHSIGLVISQFPGILLSNHTNLASSQSFKISISF